MLYLNYMKKHRLFIIPIITEKKPDYVGFSLFKSSQMFLGIFIPQILSKGILRTSSVVFFCRIGVNGQNGLRGIAYFSRNPHKTQYE